MARRMPLVLQHMENVSSSALGKFQHIIRDYVRNKHGIYALYKRGSLYYVGLASNLRGRLNSHLRDRHKRLWDTFAIYLTMDNRYMKELESLVLRITRPKGNRVKGGFARSENLIRRLAQEIRTHALREIDGMLGRRRAVRLRTRKGRQRRIRAADLNGLFTHATTLRATYKGTKYRARVSKNGTVRLRNRTFTSVSAAAKYARDGHKTNGWSFWRVKNQRGNWVRLQDYRG